MAASELWVLPHMPFLHTAWLPMPIPDAKTRSYKVHYLRLL